MDTLPDWLRLAITNGSTQWVKQFIQTYLPPLQDQQISAAEFAQALDKELQLRQLDTPSRQRNYRSNVVQAIKSVDPNHPAIALVSLTTEQYRELNDIARGKLADRETRYFTSDQAEAIVERATGLLDSAEPTEVAAGLAVLIGRRISEILLSSFAPKTAWSLTFSEMSKKQGADGLTIEIPTLAPAEAVLQAIERLQSRLGIDDLKLEAVSPKGAKQRVNSRYSEPVAARCVEQFSDLVPARSDRENLYTHIFRAVYATIAAHWFCPPTVPEHHFKAEIQGHFTISSTGQKLPNYSARASYDDYAIGTADGNRDGRLGIKLGLLPGLEVLEVFRKPQLQPQLQPEPNPSSMTHPSQPAQAESIAAVLTEAQPPQPEEAPMRQPTEKPKTKRPELYAHDLERMARLMAKRGVTGSAAELFHALLNAFEAGETAQQQQQTQTMRELTSSLTWFTDRIDVLEQTCQQLQAERDRLQAAQTPTEELNRLREENAQLKRELQDTQSRLEGIQRVLGGSHLPTSMSRHHPTLAPTPGVTVTTPTPTPVPAATPSTAPQPASPGVRRNRADTTEKLNQIIDALMSWNTAQESADTQLRVSIPAIKGIATAMGASYQAAIQEVMKQRAGELEEHHRRLLIGTRHNAGVMRKDEVLQAIARDYLGLEKWYEVKYAG